MKTIAVEILKAMVAQLEKECEFYRTDLCRDIEILTVKSNNLPAYWLARERGTSIISFDRWESMTGFERRGYMDFGIDLVQHHQEHGDDTVWLKLSEIYDDEKAKIEILHPKELIEELGKIKNMF